LTNNDTSNFYFILHSYNLKKFNYNPQAGLVGSLVKDQKSIKCTGSHNGISETQVYELQKIGN
jgi:hypothetical protein